MKNALMRTWNKPRFVIITGLSGAGKSTVSGILEDLGYFCVDNLPTTLLPKFAEIFIQTGWKINQIALVIDVRERMFFESIGTVLGELAGLKLDYQLLFLEASDEVLMRRYTETRRRHPLDQGDLRDSIRRERKMLRSLRQRAHVIIDTDKYNVRTLKQRMIELFGGDGAHRMTVNLITFGYKYGIPPEADIVMDVRFLPNPYYESRLRKYNGTHKKVKSYVLGHRRTRLFLKKLLGLLKFFIPYYEKEGKSYLTIGLGCTGGRHRSVVIGKYLEDALKTSRRAVKVQHRDLEQSD